MFGWDIVGPILASFGGASLIVGGLAHWLGGVWANRIATATVAKYQLELANTKAANQLALEEFKTKSEAELKIIDQFNGISTQVYQEFFKKRVDTYTRLLKFKNKYISDMHEDVAIEQTERWGYAYHESYKDLRKEIIESQLYISTDLEKLFQKLRIEAAKYINEADLEEGYAYNEGQNATETFERKSIIYDKLAENTSNTMRKVIKQIDMDIQKIRGRIELDNS